MNRIMEISFYHMYCFANYSCFHFHYPRTVLAWNCFVKTLDLSRNDLGPDGASALAAVSCNFGYYHLKNIHLSQWFTNVL